jgi:hypothetical protein
MLLKDHRSNSILNNFISNRDLNFLLSGSIRENLQAELLKCVSALFEEVDLKQFINDNNSQKFIEDNQADDKNVAKIVDYQAFMQLNNALYKERIDSYTPIPPQDTIDKLLDSRKETLENQIKVYESIKGGFTEIDNYLRKNNKKELANDVIAEALKDSTWFERLCNWLVKFFGIPCETNISRREGFASLLEDQELVAKNLEFNSKSMSTLSGTF